jgi:hypothetical protein
MVEDDGAESIITTTLSTLQKGKAHLAKIEETIHTISDKTKVPTWGVVLAVVSVIVVILLLLALLGYKLFQKFRGKDGKLGKSMLGNSMQLLRGSFKDKVC